MEEPPQGALRAPRSHTSAESAARESSYGSARTAESDARREAWARHPYYSSQEEQQQQQQLQQQMQMQQQMQQMQQLQQMQQMQQMQQQMQQQPYAAPLLEQKSSTRSKHGSRKGHHRSGKSSKHGSSATSAGGGGAGEVGSGMIPSDKQQLQMQIDQNRDALMRHKELKKKQEAYRAMRENTAAAPSLAALLLVCIWISLVSGFSILAFGWIFNVFVQATPFFYVSLGTGSSLVLLGSFLAAFRSKTPASVAFGP